MTKKITIILVAFILILASSIFFFIYFSKNKNSGIEKQENSEVISQSLPIGPQKREYIVQNQNNISGLKEQINFLLEDAEITTGPENIQWAQFKDNNGKIVSLDYFVDASGIKLNPGLKEIVDKEKYSLFYCPNSSKTSLNIGILLNAKLEGDYYKSSVNFTKIWEQSMVNDLKNLLFAGANIDTEYIKSQNVVFRDINRGKVVDFTDKNGTKRSLYYKIIDESIFITNQLQCFENVSDALESNDP